MSWPVAGALLGGFLVLGGLVGLVRVRALRRLLLGLAVVVALVAFVPVRCATSQADSSLGTSAGQLGGQSWCENPAGRRLPEVAALDGDAPGYALSLAAAAAVLGGSALVGRRRRAAEVG